MKLILFDIDGTLLVTRGAGKRSLERAYEEMYGVPGAWGDKSFKGMTDQTILRELVNKHLRRDPSSVELEELSSRYLKIFAQEIRTAPGYELMAGAKECVEKFAEASDFFVALETGNLEPAAWEKLSRGGMKEFFRTGGFGSDSESRAEIVRIAIRRAEAMSGAAFRLSDILVVGDAPQDIIAANEVGVRSVAVLNDRAEPQIFDGLEPQRIINNLSELEVASALP